MLFKMYIKQLYTARKQFEKSKTFDFINIHSVTGGSIWAT